MSNKTVWIVMEDSWGEREIVACYHTEEGAEKRVAKEEKKRRATCEDKFYVIAHGIKG